MAEIVINTDGTTEGTSLKVDGKDITKDEYVVGINFYSSAPWKSKYDNSVLGGFTSLSYETIDGEGKRESHSYGESNIDYSKTIGKEDTVIRKIGEEVNDEIKDLVDKIEEKSKKKEIPVNREKLLKRSKVSLKDKLSDLEADND